MAIVEYYSEATFVLWDKDEEFLTVPAAASTTEATAEVDERESDHSGEELDGEPNNVEARL